MPRKPNPIQTARIPLVGSFNTRLFWNAAGAGGSASGFVGMGVVGIMIVGAQSTPTTDQRFINAIPDRVGTEMTGSEKFYVYKRPGFETNSTPEASSAGTAIKIWTGQGNGDKIISAFGLTNSTIYDGTSSIGTITGVARDITEREVAGTANLVIPVGNNKAYYYADGGSMTEITDSDYPGNASQTTVGTFVHLDGYSFIMTLNGRIYNSDLNSIANWTATSYLSAGMYPDLGVGLSRYRNFILAFGRESTEFFKNIGNPTGSPLQRVDEYAFRIGALSADSILPIEDNVIWVGSAETGNISVYMLDSLKPKRISTDEIDGQLGWRGGTTVYLTSAKLFGHTLVFLMFGSTTYVYSMEDNIWHEWTSENDVLWHKFAANTAVSSIVYSISRNDTSGKIYKINQASPVYQDDGTSYVFTIQTSKVDFDSENRKRLHRLTLVGDETINATNMSVSWSDNDYDSFTTARTIPMADDRHYLSNCGQFRRRAFKFTNTSSEPMRLEAMELTYSEMLR